MDSVTQEEPPPQVRVAAVMSTPRLGFLSTMECAAVGTLKFQVPLMRCEGAFWHHSLTRAIEGVLEAGAEMVLTIDYDSVFCSAQGDDDIAKLVYSMCVNPGIEVLVPMQMKREGGPLIATTNGGVDVTQPFVPIIAGNFGLTLIRATVFDRINKPWFWERPSPDGSWGENRIDADMGFWQNCRERNIGVYMAMDIPIGHLEQVVSWPGQNMGPIYQSVNDWRQNGRPATLWKRSDATQAALAQLDMGGE